MKASGAIATTQAAQTLTITPDIVYGAGLATGLTWFILGVTGMTRRVATLVGRPVAQGIILGLGFSFMLEGIEMMAKGWIVGGIALAGTFLLLSNKKTTGVTTNGRLIRIGWATMAYNMALAKRQGQGPLIHHSDRGIQYCSAYYQAIHQAHGITCSMTDGYDCYQNALAERINGILKTEFLLYRPHTLQQARQMVRQSIAIYNSQERPHLALQYKTPDAVHRASLEKLLN